MANTTATVIAGTAMLYAARRYFRDWGTTKSEAGSVLPGDGMLGSPVLQATEGVWINASVERVWPWLVQMGQDRGGLYSFSSLESVLGLQYHNAGRIHAEWQHLEPGDTIRLVPTGWLGVRNGAEMVVAAVVERRSIVLRADQPHWPWEMVWSFHLIPFGGDRCRLLVRSRLALRHPGQVLLAEFVGPARAFIARGMLLGIRRRAEKGAAVGGEPSVKRMATDDLRP